MMLPAGQWEHQRLEKIRRGKQRRRHCIIIKMYIQSKLDHNYDLVSDEECH